MHDRHTLSTTLFALCDSGIEFVISSTWEGWTIALGNKVDGIVAEQTFPRDALDKVASWLRTAVSRHFPNSDFARAY
jgi:hypothetical protein